MRKSILDRETPLELHEVPEDEGGVRPAVRMTGNGGSVVFSRKHLNDHAYESAFSLHDEDAIREVRDQLNEWLDRHGNDSRE